MEPRIDIGALAARQLADYDARRPGLLFADGSVSLALPQAFELQFEFARLRQQRGEAVAGYKIGCLSEVIRKQLGLDRPAFGHVFGSEVHPAGAELSAARFDNLAIEGEFALRLAEDVPDPDWLRRHPDRAVAGAFAVIELHHYVFRRKPNTAQELIANNAMQAGVVLPAEEDRLRDAQALLEEPLSVVINGETVGTATGAALPGGPFESLLQVAGHLARFGRRLERGMIVLTGSPLPVYPVSAGDRVEVRAPRLATVTAVVGR